MQHVVTVRRVEELLLRGVTWSMVGVIFGTLFLVLVEILRLYLPMSFGLMAATIAAAALTALFYGSMRLTLMVANFTFIATLVYTWQGAPHLGLEPLVLVGAGSVDYHGPQSPAAQVLHDLGPILYSGYEQFCVNADLEGIAIEADLVPVLPPTPKLRGTMLLTSSLPGFSTVSTAVKSWPWLTSAGTVQLRVSSSSSP